MKNPGRMPGFSFVPSSLETGSEGCVRVGEQGHVAGSLDCLPKRTLFTRGRRKTLPGVHLPVGGQHASQHVDVLVVDVETTVGTGLHLELRPDALELAH